MPALPRPFHAVILDMDGTLLDTEIVYVRAFVDSMREFGHDLPEAFLHELIGGTRGTFQRKLRERLGPDFPYDDHRDAYVRLRAARLAAGVPLKPGAMELVEALGARGVKLAVATAATREHADAHLARAGLRPHFASVLTRDDVVRSKPDPDVFLASAAALGEAAEACVAVEDSHNRVRAAHAAGTMVVMVPDIVAANAEMHALCAAVLPDLVAVREMLLAQLGG